MKNRRIACKILIVFFFCNYNMSSGQEAIKENVKKISNREMRTTLINMGIQNLPDLFYEHYYRYPESIQELCSFIENHYDYKNHSNEIWKTTLLYLKKKEKKINIISQDDLFIVYQGKNISYNNDNVCTIVALHYPEVKYRDYITRVNLYDFNGRNLREILGTEKTDSIIDVFLKMKKDVYNNNVKNYYVQKNNCVKIDKYQRVLLEYKINSGLQLYCLEDTPDISDYSFFEKLDSVCSIFCKQQNIDKMIFSSLVLSEKSE